MYKVKYWEFGRWCETCHMTLDRANEIIKSGILCKAEIVCVSAD
jgi:hypothetical protein